MPISLSLSALFHLLASALGMLTGIILWIYPRHKWRNPNKLLAASILSVTLGMKVGFLLETGLIYHVPHVYRLGNFFALLTMPSSYLYVRNVIKQRKLRWVDLLHALPALIYIVDFVPFFVLSTEEKIQILNHDLSNLNQLLEYRQSWLFPGGFHLVARYILICIYWLLQVHLLIQLVQSYSKELIEENKPWFRWMVVYIALQFFYFAPFFLAFFLGKKQLFWYATDVSAALLLIFTALSLFFSPSILYAIKGVLVSVRDIPPEEPAHSLASKKILYLNQEKLRTISSQLQTLMHKQTFFLRQGLSMQDLADALDIPVHHLSSYLNHYVGMNFNEYLNQQRVQYCIEKMQQGAWKHLTLEALALDCGFSNRNTFTAAFKKFTGETPSEYLKRFK